MHDGGPAPRTVGDLIALLEEAKLGSLSSDEIKARWSTEPQLAVLRQLRDDLRFAVEHMPTDVEKWASTPDYDDLDSYLQQLYRLNREDAAEALPSTIVSPWTGEGEMTMRQAIRAAYVESVAARWLRRAMRRRPVE